jgi:hypothetical protein
MRRKEKYRKGYAQCFRKHRELRSISFLCNTDETVHLLERGIEVVFDGRALYDGGFDGIRCGHDWLRLKM